MPGGQDGFARLRRRRLGLWLERRRASSSRVAGTRLGRRLPLRDRPHAAAATSISSGDDAGIANTIRGGTGAFTDSDAELGLTTPASLSFGLHQDVTDRLAVMAEAQWTDWSVFDQLTVKFDNPAQPDSVTEEEWKDTWFFALGTTYQATDAVTLRAGVAYDQSPVKGEYRTPRIPDERPLLAVARRRLAAAPLARPRRGVHLHRRRGQPGRPRRRGHGQRRPAAI